jgi:hypothetical protein
MKKIRLAVFLDIEPNCSAQSNEWIEKLGVLNDFGVQPIVITEKPSDLSDRLAAAGICAIDFALNDVPCRASEKRVLSDLTKLLQHCKCNAVIIRKAKPTLPMRAAGLLGLPAVMKYPERSLEQVEVLSLAKSLQRTAERDGLALRVLVQNPTYASPELDLCWRVPFKNAPDHEYFTRKIELLPLGHSGVQTIISTDKDSISRIRLNFFITRLNRCLCPVAESSIRINVKAALNPDVVLRTITVPLASISSEQSSELSFTPLASIDKCGIIFEFAPFSEASQYVSVQIPVKRGESAAGFPVLQATVHA